MEDLGALLGVIAGHDPCDATSAATEVPDYVALSQRGAKGLRVGVAPECFSEGTVIYINRDHPLYRREARKAETHTMHLARLLTQEITLMKDAPRDPRKAFDRQSKLLRDAFTDKED